MRYQRYGPFIVNGRVDLSKPINAAFMNRMEDFLSLLPAERPYERHVFLNDVTALDASLFNDMERFLSQVESETPYQRLGPFVNGGFHTIYEILTHIEDFLVTLSVDPEEQGMTALLEFGSRVPRGWFDRQRNFIENPEYRKRAMQPEPARYEQPLVEYDYEREP